MKATISDESIDGASKQMYLYSDLQALVSSIGLPPKKTRKRYGHRDRQTQRQTEDIQTDRLTDR